MSRELIVFCGFRDWANTCNAWAKAIRSHSERFDARCVMRDRHPYGYAQDIVLGRPLGGHGDPKGYSSVDEIRSLIESAAWYVHGGDSNYRSWRYFTSLVGDKALLKHKRLAVWHCGSAYRRAHQFYNRADRRLGIELRLLAYDLVRLAPRDPLVRAAPHNAIDASQFQGVIRPSDRVVLSHSPSKRRKKGTRKFLAAVDSLRQKGIEFEIDLIEGVSHAECIRRKARSHIFFDQMHRIGGIGTSAVEAAASGACVLADFHNIPPSVQAATGELWPIVSVEGFDSLIFQLESLLSNDDLRLATSHRTQKWFNHVFSPTAVAAFFDNTFH